MKKQTKLTKTRFILLCLFSFMMSFGGVRQAWADELTIYDDADYSSDYVPFDGYNADAVQQNQMIFPSTVLTSLEGKKITSMTFYYKKNETSGTNVGNWVVSLAETSATALTALNTTTQLTQVYSGAITPDTEAKTITIDFDNGYDYSGGNLLVEFNHPTASGYKKFTFWCAYITPAPAYTHGTTRTYLPKTTFTYEASASNGPDFAVKDGSTKLTSPYAYNFGLATAGTTKVFTLCNPGTEATPIAINTTGANGFTAVVEDNATSIPAGGEKTLTITMPNATASGSIVVTPTGDGLSAFTLNVSGTVRDPNKVYLDFSDGKIPDGWTSVKTGSYGSAWTVSNGYISQSGSSSSYSWAFTSPKLDFSNGEEVFFETAKYGSSSWYSPSVTVEYTTDATGATGWTAIGSAYTDDTYGNWTKRSVTIPVDGVKRIRFNGWYIHIRNIYGGQLPLEPKMVVTQPTALDFGLFDKDEAPAPTKTFTIANTGLATLNGINVTSANAAFTITNAPTSLAAGTSQEVTITMATGTAGALSSLITVSATDMEDASFTVTGCVKPADMPVEEFTDGLPANWTNASWTFANGEATGKSSSAYLTTPKLSFTAGDFLIIKAKRYDSDASDYLTVQGSDDDGATWEAYNHKLQDADGLTYPGYGMIVLNDIPSTVTKLRFVGFYVIIDEIYGLTYDANDPSIAVYSDAQATQSVTSGTVKDFGWTTADAIATYYIKNGGTGTLTINSISSVDGFTTATADNAMTVAAGADPLALTVTMTAANNVGYHHGTITVSTDGGDFELPVTGMVRDADKFYIDFSADNATFPAGWSTGSWSISDNAAVASGALESIKLSAAANEKMWIEAISTGSYWSSAALSYSYSTDNGANWTSATSIASQLNTSTYSVIELTTPDADNDCDVIVKFTGSNVKVRRLYGFTVPVAPLMITTAADMAFGVKTTESAEQTFTISNEGTAALEGLSVTLGKTGDDAEYSIALYDGENVFTGTELAIGKTITVKVKQLYDLNKLGAKSDVLTISATNQTPVQISLSGRSVSADTWTEDFASGIPTIWSNTGWQMASEMSDYAGMVYSYANTNSLMTPRLAAAANEELTFEVKGASTTYPLIVEYSTNREDWTQYGDAIVTEGEQTFVAPTDGNYYLRFSGRYDYLDNFVGFRVNHPDYALAETSTFSGAGSEIGWGNVTVTRSYVAGWNTLALPFALTSEMIEAHFPAAARFYTLTGYNATTKELTFTNVTSLAAGEPAIVYMPEAITNASANYTMDFGLTNVTVTSATMGNADHTYNGVSMKANFSDELSMDGKHGVTAAGKLAPGSSTATLKSLRAYFTGVPQGAGVRIVVIDEATGISCVVGRELSVEGQSYNLQGQRVESLKKGGLYIKNGRKIVMK